MELTDGILAEQLPRSDGGSMVNLISSEENILPSENLTELEVTEKVKSILLDRIHQGDRQAVFQLGQLHFEQVLSRIINLKKGNPHI